MEYWEYVKLVAIGALVILGFLGCICLMGVLCWLLWPPLIFIIGGIGILILVIAYILYRIDHKEENEIRGMDNEKRNKICSH